MLDLGVLRVAQQFGQYMSLLPVALAGPAQIQDDFHWRDGMTSGRADQQPDQGRRKDHYQKDEQQSSRPRHGHFRRDFGGQCWAVQRDWFREFGHGVGFTQSMVDSLKCKWTRQGVKQAFRDPRQFHETARTDP